MVLTIGYVPLAMAQSVSSQPGGSEEEEKPVEGTASECTAAINYKLGREQRQLRAAIFGQQKAADLPLGSVRFDFVYKEPWIKIKPNEWRSLGPSSVSETLDDWNMDNDADVRARRGILETRKAMTSELIPPILQVVRAAQCRMRSTCLLIKEARDPKNWGGMGVKVYSPGCKEFEANSIDACFTTDISSIDAGTCDATVDMIMDREMKMLELALSYDAAYRSLLQFSGTFEGFLDDFRFPLLQPLWQMVRAVGALDDLPCFISQCDE